MEKYYCPTCKNLLSEESGCGSVSYFCKECKGLVSRKKIISEKDLNTLGCSETGEIKEI